MMQSCGLALVHASVVNYFLSTCRNVKW